MLFLITIVFDSERNFSQNLIRLLRLGNDFPTTVTHVQRQIEDKIGEATACLVGQTPNFKTVWVLEWKI